MGTGRPRGRPPKPVELRVIEGNPGKRALPETVKPPPEKPNCPAWLQTYAKTVWARLVPRLDELGLIAYIDVFTLAAYCEAVADYRKATEQLNASALLVTGQKGNAVTNPLWRIKRDAAATMNALAGQLGLSPADRVRLGPAVIHHIGGAGLDLEDVLAG